MKSRKRTLDEVGSLICGGSGNASASEAFFEYRTSSRLTRFFQDAETVGRAIGRGLSDMRRMCTATIIVLALVIAARAQDFKPVIDNERVTVWDTVDALPPAKDDFVAVSLKGSSRFLVGGFEHFS
jgi:hypothetical protein